MAHSARALQNQKGKNITCELCTELRGRSRIPPLYNCQNHTPEGKGHVTRSCWNLVTEWTTKADGVSVPKRVRQGNLCCQLDSTIDWNSSVWLIPKSVENRNLRPHHGLVVCRFSVSVARYDSTIEHTSRRTGVHKGLFTASQKLVFPTLENFPPGSLALCRKCLVLGHGLDWLFSPPLLSVLFRGCSS